MKQIWDVVIVGGGLAGYVAANYLSKSKQNVLILEKSKHLGGRAKTDHLKGQYFNLGPHALYKKGLAMPILEELEISVSGKTPKTGGKLLEDYKSYVAPFSPAGVLRTDFLNWRERFEWVRCFGQLNKVDIEQLQGITFQEWVQKATKTEKVRSLLYVLGRLATYCDSPDQASAKVIVSHLQKVMGGVIYVDGGWKTIIDQLHNRAIVSGIEVKEQTSVTKLEKTNKGSFQVTLSQEETIQAKQVLYTGGPQGINRLLDEKEFEGRSFFEAIIPVKAATLDVALEKLPNPRLTFAMGLNAPFYYSLHSNYANLSDNGKSHILHVLKYHKPNENINSKEVKVELEQFLEKIQPGWREYEITSRCLPNITVNNRLPKVGDESMFNQSETIIENLFIAGDWASPSAILSEGAIHSGKVAANEMVLKRGELGEN